MVLTWPGRCHVMFRLVLLLGLVPVMPMPVALAEVVAVNRGAGQGLVFQRRNICYLILPDHVSGRSLNLTLSAGAPPVVGAARVFQRFSDIDLAVAVLDDDLQGRCVTRYEDLPLAVDAAIGSGELTLVRVEASGLVTREPVRVREILYESIVVEPVADTVDLYQGTSGAFLFAGTVPVAMMLTAQDDGSGRAIRMDAVMDRIGRLIEGGVGSGDLGVPRPPVQPVANALAYRLGACMPEPLDPDHGCAQLASAEGFVLLPPGRASFVLEFESAQAQPLKAIEIASQWQEGAAHTVPRSMIIEVDSSVSGNPRWRRFAAGDMSPFGSFSYESGAGQTARRVRITVLDAWDERLPVRLDQVVLR